MRIKNLNITSFGKLEDVSIGLDDKITVISGKNEAGKSSIATFIKYMLYGFDATKKQDVSENQKKKYMPWSGYECSGEMTFIAADGKVYTAVRKTASRSQNTLLDENEMPVTGENAGDYFFGINENAYRKTAFIGQRETAFSDEGELDEAIRNMVYSADESVDSRKALKKLEELKKFYLGKAGRSGEIYETDKELEALIAERDKWQDGHKELLTAEYQLSEIQKKIAYNKEKKEILEAERQNLEYYDARCKLLQLDEAKKKLEKSRDEFEAFYKKLQNDSFVPDNAFEKELKEATDSLADAKKKCEDAVVNLERAKESLDSVYADESLKRISDILTEEKRTAEDLSKKIKDTVAAKKNAKLFAIILTVFIVTIPIAIFFYIKSSRLSKTLSAICEKYGCDSIEQLQSKLVQGESFKTVEQNARKSYDEAVEAKNILDKYLSDCIKKLEELANKGGFDVNDAEKYISVLGEWLRKCDELKGVCREDFVAYNTLAGSVNEEELKELSARFDERIPVRDVKTVSQQLAFYTQANEALAVKERELEKSTAVLSSTLPKPSEIQTKILSLSAKREEMNDKHKALSLAVETLERASENMRSEAAPRIAAETSSLFSKITDGKYKALYADSGMNLTFLESGEAEVRDAGYLSAGTLDAAYISLRIALCEFLYKEHPTLVFDDAFANMDGDRLCNMLDFICELSKDFQIVILSCHDREKEYLKGKAKIIDFAI